MNFEVGEKATIVFLDCIKSILTSYLFWFGIAVFCWVSLCNPQLYTFLGFYENIKIWFSITAFFSTSIVIQGIWSTIKEYFKKREVLSHLDDLTSDETKILKDYVKEGYKTFKIDRTSLARSRIISRGLAVEKGAFAEFPNYVWKALKKKFGGKK